MARPFTSDTALRYAAAYEAVRGNCSASFSDFKVWPFFVGAIVLLLLGAILPLWMMFPVLIVVILFAGAAASAVSYKKKPVTLTEREREVVARVSSIRLGSLFLLVPIGLFALFALLTLIWPA